MDLYQHWDIRGNAVRYTGELIYNLYSIIHFCCARQYILKDKIKIVTVKKNYQESEYTGTEMEQWFADLKEEEFLKAEIYLYDAVGNEAGMWLSQNQITVYADCNLEIQSEAVIDEICNAVFQILNNYIQQSGSSLNAGIYSKSIRWYHRIPNFLRKSDLAAWVGVVGVVAGIVAAIFTVLSYFK